MVPCDDLVGWGGAGGRKVQEGGDICIHRAGPGCIVSMQKLSQHCKAIIFQLKKRSHLVKKKKKK